MNACAAENKAMRELLVNSARRIFTDYNTRDTREAAEAGQWPSELWDAIATAGLAAAATSGERGGVDADVTDVAALVHTAGGMAVPVPLVETLLAEQVLAAAGLPAVGGPATIGPVLRGDTLRLARTPSGWRLDGVLHRIPWGRDARALALIARHEAGWATVRVPNRQAVEIEEGWNFAREPRDSLRFENFAVAQEDVVTAGGMDLQALLLRGAFFRTLQMAGALEQVLRMTVGYANERVQFGRPIAKFQAIQQQIAVLATHVGASSAAANGALEAGRGAGGGAFQVAAAKVRVGEAAGIAASIAHQVHGAMGFTHEHALHRSTRRLWSWRDEFGGEQEWAAYVGRLAVAVGGEGLWAFLTAPTEKT